MQDAIEIRGLKTSFPRFQLGPLDLTVPPGAMYGLVGPNGAGKTTVLDLIFGLGAPRDAGDIRVLGLDNRKDEAAGEVHCCIREPAQQLCVLAAGGPRHTVC